MSIVSHYQLHCFNLSLFLYYLVPPPTAKRPTTLEHDPCHPPVCDRAPSSLYPNDVEKLKETLPYYHWMALLLRDKFTDPAKTKFTLDAVDVDVSSQALDTIIKQFRQATAKQWDNEGVFSSHINWYLDRFYFDNNHVHEGAVLSQFPLEGTRACDCCIGLFEPNDWTVKYPLLFCATAKLDPRDFPKAVTESRLCSICCVAKSDCKFPYMFSIPFCRNAIKLEMHISVNGAMECFTYVKHRFSMWINGPYAIFEV